MVFADEMVFIIFIIFAGEQLKVLSRKLTGIPDLIKSAKSNKMCNSEIYNLEKRLFIQCIKDHQNIYLYVIIVIRYTGNHFAKHLSLNR